MQPTSSNLPFVLSLWRHRSLLRQFTARQIEARNRGSFLGMAWAVLNPLLMLGLYTFIFSVVFPGQFGSGPAQPRYALIIFSGLICYHLMADVLANAPGIITSNPNFVRKVVFPLEILPAAVVGASLFHLLVSVGLFLVGALVLGHAFTVQALWLPLILLPLLLLALGLGWMLSALGVFLRDLQQVMGFLNLILMYSSCIFFPPSRVAELVPAVWAVLRFNPLLQTIDLVRQTILWGAAPNLGALAYIWACGVVVFAAGFAFFRATRPAFADVV